MKRNKGISLIVLVITIIVMIILAGSIILSLSNNGIIGKANEAVEKTNINQVRTLAELKWAEAYLDEKINTDEEYSKAVKNALEQEGIDTSKYVIVTTANGVEVVDGWIQEGLTVRKGNIVLTIGDDITYKYDETVEGVKQGIKWKVLGASDKGELLIMSTTDIAQIQFGDPAKTDLEKCQNDWLTAVDTLDEFCEPYIHGKSVTDARSIRIEDVDKITGYDKTEYGKDQLYKYGAEVVFTHNGTNKPSYELKGISNSKGILENSHSNFYYFNGNEFLVLNTATGIITSKNGDVIKTITNGEEIVTLQNNYWSYVANMDTKTKAYTMIFKDAKYWLASAGTALTGKMFGYVINAVYDGMAVAVGIWKSTGSANDGLNIGVRAVVSLSPDIQPVGSSVNGWSY